MVVNDRQHSAYDGTVVHTESHLLTVLKVSPECCDLLFFLLVQPYKDPKNSGKECQEEKDFHIKTLVCGFDQAWILLQHLRCHCLNVHF